MGNRIKKDAISAIDSLKHYLRRDKPGLQLLDAIGRYIGSLRQAQSTLKAETTTLGESLQKIEARYAKALLEITNLKQQLNREQSRHRQVTNDLSQANDKIKELEKELEPEDFDTSEVPTALQVKVSRYKKLFKELRRHVKRPPYRAAVKQTDVYDIADFVTPGCEDPYRAIGLFAAACCLINIPIGFISEDNILSELHKSRNLDDSVLRDFICWIRDWMQWSENQDKCYSHYYDHHQTLYPHG